MKWNELRMGTVGGTICSIWASISLGNIMETALMAAVGTLVSIAIGHLLKHCLRKKG